MKIRTNPLASGLILAALVAGTVAVPAAGSVLAARGSQPAPSVSGDPDDGGQVRSAVLGDPDDGGQLAARLVAFSDPDSGGQLH